MTRVWQLRLGVLALSTVVGSVVGGVSVWHKAERPSHDSAAHMLPVTDQVEACRAARTVSHANAVALAKENVRPFTVSLPDASTPAGRALGDISSMTWCPDDGSLLAQYSTGIDVLLRSHVLVNRSGGAKAVFESVASRSPYATVETIGGAPALTVAPGPISQEEARSADGSWLTVLESAEGEFGMVSAVRGDAWVTLRGNHRLSLEDLKRAFASID